MLTISVLNPNSSSRVTQKIKDSVRNFNNSKKHKILCNMLNGSPEGIETDEHVKEVIPKIKEFVLLNKADIYIIACFSDPGLSEIKAITNAKVIGIAEASYEKSISLNSKFGIISILEPSIIRHEKYLKKMGILHWLAGDRSIGLGVDGLDNKGAYDSILETAKLLKNKDHARSIILGCAGMGKYKNKLEKDINLTVLDPIETAVSEALKN